MPVKKRLRVLMVEDDVADAELVASELERAGIAVTAERVDTTEAFMAAIHDFEPDVVLCDHGVPAFDVRSAIRTLRADLPAVPFILVPGFLDERTAVEFLRERPEDIVTKGNLARLPAAITAARALRRRLGKLTRRQLEVLRLVAEGHSTREVAGALGISIKTVETHRSKIMKRMDIHDLVSLVRYSARVGIISPDI